MHSSALRIALASIAVALSAGTMPTSALAQGQVEVANESGQHCGSVTMGSGHSVSGGCLVHTVSEDNAVTWNHTGTSEVVTTACESEFTGNVDENGEGYADIVDGSIHTNPLTGCVITPCDEAGHEEIEWPGLGLGSGGIGTGVGTFCIRPSNTSEGVGNTPCTVTLTGVQVGHQQEATANEAPCAENPAREISGHWITEEVQAGAEVAVEVVEVLE